MERSSLKLWTAINPWLLILSHGRTHCRFAIYIWKSIPVTICWGHDCSSTFLFWISKYISAMRGVELNAISTVLPSRVSPGRLSKSIRRPRIKCTLLGGPDVFRGRRRRVYSRPPGTSTSGQLSMWWNAALPTRGWMGSNSLALMKSAIERKNIFPLFINWTRAVDGFYGAVRSEK